MRRSALLAPLLLAVGCHTFEDCALEVRPRDEQAGSVEPLLVASVTSAASAQGLVITSLPFGTVDADECAGATQLCAFRSTDDSDLYCVMLWLERRGGRLLARVRQWRWASAPDDATPVWEHLLRVVRDDPRLVAEEVPPPEVPEPQ